MQTGRSPFYDSNAPHRMFRIRRIHDAALDANRSAIAEAQAMLREHFPAARPEDVDELPERLENPFRQRFVTLLYVAEGGRGRVQGVAVVLHDPVVRFCYLDYLASAKGRAGRGIGGALYERVRDEVFAHHARGLFFECLPDGPADCPDPHLRKQNAARLKFYERYGARPIVGTEFEAPVAPENRCQPHLVYDGLGRDEPLRRDFARKVVRAVLERKYGYLCPPEYVERVVKSFRDDPVRLREFRYAKQPQLPGALPAGPARRAPIAFVVTDRHEIHHVRERGYVESPVRIKAIQSELQSTGLFETVAPRDFPDKHITAVHGREYFDYIRRACAGVPEGKSVYPYVFPIRNAARPPRDLSIRAGYYCIDTFTPLNQSVMTAARRAVDCALTAAERIVDGHRLAYALVRPPGHHAESKAFGGFCYFNNAAIAAQHLARFGKVAILDVDYHHGNGQQEIFYERNDVLTVSIHGDPAFAYPYFTGFADERGSGAGEGFNVNIPLPEKQNGEQYRKALAPALRLVTDFRPAFLVVALGLDPAKGDPTGTWSLAAKDFEANGRMIGGMKLPTLVVQEGGYRTRTLGVNARHFFQGLAQP
ncbi:MAG: histone deacetylase family protein [Planctomycetaceae bacterium]